MKEAAGRKGRAEERQMKQLRAIRKGGEGKDKDCCVDLWLLFRAKCEASSGAPICQKSCHVKTCARLDADERKRMNA
eukprot:747205-Hanusia_phi.AAC.7